MLQLSVKNIKLGRPTYLIPDEEAFLVAAEEIECSQGFTMDNAMIAYELYCVVSSVQEIPIFKEIYLKSAAKSCGTVVKQVNVSEEAHDKQRNNTRTGLIKVSRLRNNRANQRYPRLYWFLFHKIAHIYRDKKTSNCARIATYSRPPCQL